MLVNVAQVRDSVRFLTPGQLVNDTVFAGALELAGFERSNAITRLLIVYIPMLFAKGARLIFVVFGVCGCSCVCILFGGVGVFVPGGGTWARFCTYF